MLKGPCMDNTDDHEKNHTLLALQPFDNGHPEFEAFGLSLAEAEAEVTRVIKVVNTWQQHFEAVWVSEEDIESLALRIDGEGWREAA